MKAELIPIGNSRGVRIPKPIIEQCRFGKSVELRVEDNCVVISPDRSPRQGWEAAFRAANSSAEDELLIPDDLSNDFDRKDWHW